MYASMHYSVPSIAASVVYAAATSQPVVALHGPVKEVLTFGPAADFVARLAQLLIKASAASLLLRDTVTCFEGFRSARLSCSSRRRLFGLCAPQVFNVNVPNSAEPERPAPKSFAVTTPGVINYVGDTLVQKQKGSNVYYLSGGVAADCRCGFSGVGRGMFVLGRILLWLVGCTEMRTSVSFIGWRGRAMVQLTVHVLLLIVCRVACVRRHPRNRLRGR